MPVSSISEILWNFTKTFTSAAIVYAIGKYDLSIAWLISPVILTVVHTEWRKETELKRSVARASAMLSEKEVILGRLHELPTWVFFPDVERAEWLNKIFMQVWPHLNHYTKTLLKSIEPGIRDALAAYQLHGFRFERWALGSVPMRVGGVKVYDRNVSRNEIIMDLDLYYAGDCDIFISVSGFTAGIKDLQIYGKCRVIMRPLISSIPLIGGLQVFFLNHPTIEFNLVGMADLLDTPGLSAVLRRIITEQVAYIMVLPNKLSILLSDEVAPGDIKTPEPQGVLRVHLVEGKNLMARDVNLLGKGKSDPYAVLNVGAQQFRTHTIDKTVNPKWNFWCEFVVDFQVEFPEAIILETELFDADKGSHDDLLGRASVDVNDIIKTGGADLWLTLEDAKHGEIYLRLTWLTLSSNYEDLASALRETSLLGVTSLSTAVLTVYLDACLQLPLIKSAIKPDPFVAITVNKKTVHSATLMQTSDPVYEQGFTFLVNQPRVDTLFIKVIDQKSEKVLGTFEQPLLAMLKMDNMEIKKQPFALAKAGPNSKIEMALLLQVAIGTHIRDRGSESSTSKKHS